MVRWIHRLSWNVPPVKSFKSFYYIYTSDSSTQLCGGVVTGTLGGCGHRDSATHPMGFLCWLNCSSTRSTSAFTIMLVASTA